MKLKSAARGSALGGAEREKDALDLETQSKHMAIRAMARR